MRISVVGLGKLGTPWLAVLASRGIDVVGVDRIPGHVAAILDRRTPISEPRLQALLSEATGRIEATSDIKAAVSASDVTFVVVPTPSGADGTFSNLHVISAIREIGAALAISFAMKATYYEGSQFCSLATSYPRPWSIWEKSMVRAILL